MPAAVTLLVCQTWPYMVGVAGHLQSIDPAEVTHNLLECLSEDFMVCHVAPSEAVNKRTRAPKLKGHTCIT